MTGGETQPARTVLAWQRTGLGVLAVAGLLLGRDPVAAACMGTVAASFAVEGFGPDGLLTATAGQRDHRLADLAARIGHLPSIPTIPSVS